VAGGDETTGACVRSLLPPAGSTARHRRCANVASVPFGAGLAATFSAAEFAENARRIEGLGYDIGLVADHVEESWFAAGPALAAAAIATTTLRVGSLVYSNNLRQPALLAREAATVDVLSGGRFEFGIGAGYYLPEYSRTGITIPPPRVRVEQLRETIAVVKGLWSNGPLSFSGEHFTITEMEGWPKPLQVPRPPTQVGGGGRRMLGLAAQEGTSSASSLSLGRVAASTMAVTPTPWSARK
jgi:probable F420-dependent oxidoreductase